MRKCAFVTSSQTREIAELILVRFGEGGPLTPSLSHLRFVFSSWTTILFFSGCASHLHTFVSSQGGLQLIKAFSYNLPKSCCFQPLPAAEREHCLAQGGKKKEKKRKRRGEESRREGGGIERKATRSSVQNKRGGLV